MKFFLGSTALAVALTGAFLLQIWAGQAPEPEEQIAQTLLSAIDTLNTLDQEVMVARLSKKPQEAPLVALMTRYQAVLTALDTTTPLLKTLPRRPAALTAARQVRELRQEAQAQIVALTEQQETLRMMGGAPGTRRTP